MTNEEIIKGLQATNEHIGRHFPQIVEVLEQIKGEADGK